jgi:hypothetical protein
MPRLKKNAAHTVTEIFRSYYRDKGREKIKRDGIIAFGQKKLPRSKLKK